VPTLVFYISGHGFGHASRNIEVINTVLARRSDLRIIARTTAPQWLFDRTIPAGVAERFEWTACETDTGAVQIDSLHLDQQQTTVRARAFMAHFEARVQDEVAFLHERKAILVVSDIPALGIAAGKRAGLPAAALGNFTWDWIYAAYPGAAEVAARIADVYANADVAIRLPMHGGFGSFRRIVDVPFVARRSGRDPGETRERLRLPRDVRLVLLSFSGHGLGRIDDGAVSALDGYAVLGTDTSRLDAAAMYDAGVRYEDVVNAVDVVVSKPGYGIISECIAHDTALLYTSRGHFPEYDVLVGEMPRYLRSRFISHDDLFAGRWQPHLDALLATPAPQERPRVDGAETVASLLLAMI
jgi:L-arabinokinase